ncbi:response regulator transcription factor [Roseomonas eburnea]|uniref:Response regulator transcription factor n=1 Tax=Neoroseomonas eburnea TaxID=1346889 RepID=A0A9X9XD51_9PROT|nr:response regulator transcription factor [Neoroseomonas eburnea]MBR0681637.1 response regulator transcription factor [Neoroseomonas eburnea]
MTLNEDTDPTPGRIERAPERDTGTSSEPPRILVVEDDDAIGEELAAILQAYGMQALRVADWDSAMQAIAAAPVDLVILDQWLGRVDALTVLPQMRAVTPAHIVILTGNKAESDRIVGLEVGADDFLQKPISGRELVARVRAHLRRQAPARPAAAEPPAPAPATTAERWRVAEGARRVLGPDGEPLPLTGTEFDLLMALMETPGEPVDRAVLSQRILKRPYRPEDRAIDNLVHNIRLKFGGERGASVITTVRNKGYAFTGFPGAV